MRGVAIAASLVLVLSAAPAFAQTPPTQQPPAQPPKTTPPAQTAPAPAPQPPAPFPQGAKIGFVIFNRVTQESSEGKAAMGKIQALQKKKQDEATQRNTALQANQQKLQASGSMMSEAARTQLEKDIEKQQVDMQRFQQDAQAELQELQKDLEADFLKKITPILQQVANEKGLHALFNAQEAGFAWVDPGLDLTAEVIKKLDAAKPTAPAKQ